LEREAIRLLAQTEGILVDPVYTGRALAGLIQRIRANQYDREETILFWHTGGTTGLFARAHELV
jgi:D-cysteine desulfhydrase